MKDLQELLSENHIKVIDYVENWKQAVEIASEPLIKENLISHIYVENMISSVQDNGPYMVLTDYFALMHAKPGEGVNQQSMSLLVTRNEIDLEGKPVKIFLILAAEDSQSHLKGLQDVIAIFMDKNKYQTILNGQKKDIIELFN
ncbi:PTS family L-ascorbate (L-asc) porter component IIA (plasmid) [Carnobacterium sp. 17-4]|uniref:PTS sugar transporter subunit IIA n=1 Tax=Carnobacterium sp. (strain 17-4) TaxID=208596 RepID=UPI000205848B|nr:PTS sugar transporter subunit IIA [Carnobacterium sp. 17-4]AEB31189.1 PTS family L-ascorbate (L-asc) porter component IIA [Carnobacterium sp. 17-4]